MKFHVTVDRHEDGVWIVECPAIPGCVSQGQTKDEALDNIKDAIVLCLDVRAERGMPLTVETLQIDVAVNKDIEKEYLRQKADQLSSDGSWDELIPLYTEIIEMEQEPHEKARAYAQRGVAYNYKGDHDLAIVDCTKGLALNPAYANAYINRGIAYDKKDEHDLAIADYTKSLELEPNNMFAYHNRGIAYINKNDFDPAIRDFNKIRERDPANPEIHLFRGFAYSLKGEHDKAIEDFTKALELTPTYANAYLCRGIAYIEQGNFLDAFNDFKKADIYQPVLKVEVSEIYVADQIADVYKDLDEEDGGNVFELYFRLLEAISKIQKILFYAPHKNAEVAHYTSLHTLKSLADKGPFRFYNAAYMNDPEEGRVFFEVMGETGKGVKKFFYEDESQPYPSPAYIGSFVKVDKEDEEKDKLFLWRTYGKNAGQEAAGACLILKHEGTVFAKTPGAQTGAMQQLQSKLFVSAGDTSNPKEKQAPKPELYEIVYSDEGNNQELSEELNELGESLKLVKKHIEEEKDDTSKKKLKKLVDDLLDTIRFLFKSRHYREEAEVRVVQIRYFDEENMTQEPNDIQVDTQQVPPRFYLETHEDFRCNEVILGPQARGVPEWKRWLKEQDETLIVKKSAINYGQRYH